MVVSGMWRDERRERVKSNGEFEGKPKSIYVRLGAENEK